MDEDLGIFGDEEFEYLVKKLEERGEYLTYEELNDEFKLYEMYLEEVSK
jgi:hypothetical protein